MMLHQPILVFDIETILDIHLARTFYQLADLSDEDVVLAVQKIRRQETGHDFARLAFHQVVCLSGLWVDSQSGQFQLFSWTQAEYTEQEILQRFVQIFDKRQPILVSWNGTQFDLPVIMQRSLYYGLSASGLFEQGERDHQKRFNNYQNRYHQQHTDLMDVLAGFNAKQFQKLDDVARIWGYPGKLGISGDDVFALFIEEKWQDIIQYCEIDVLNTWLIYLRWLLLRGFITLTQHQAYISSTIAYLQRLPLATSSLYKVEHQKFLLAWQQSAQTTSFTAQDFV